MVRKNQKMIELQQKVGKLVSDTYDDRSYVTGLKDRVRNLERFARGLFITPIAGIFMGTMLHGIVVLTKLQGDAFSWWVLSFVVCSILAIYVSVLGVFVFIDWKRV